jgi:TRAP-type C4-dicarboxylate transport system permease small subunit
MSRALRLARRLLDRAYALCGAIAALFLIVLLLVILAQMASRWLGLAFPGSTDYAGYCMAAASFFALAYTLEHGAHIRVSLLLSRLTGGARRAGELWCLAIGGGLAWYFAFYAVKAVRVSRLIHDISQGQDATPLWIPQLAMAIGTVVLAIAFTDHLLRVLLGREREVGESVAAEARGE